MIRTPLSLHRGAAALIVAACAAAISVPAALGQTTPEVSVNPSNGAAGSTTTLTLKNFDIVAQCNAQAPTRQTCIYVDFIQGSRTTTIAVATGSNSSAVRIPAACAAPTNTNCAEAGSATIKATSPNGQNASTGFTVTVTPASTTTVPGATTTTSTSTSTTTTTVATTTTVSTVVLAPTTTTTSVPVTTKKSSSHSDVPRYIAVALVVAAAAATAAVDTRLRRLRG